MKFQADTDAVQAHANRQWWEGFYTGMLMTGVIGLLVAFVTMWRG